MDALEKFSRAHVCVVGIGGVGSWIVEALARSGVGAITMIDLDEICVSNINRQLHAMDGEIGKQKTDAMAERIRAIHPGCKVNCEQTFFSKKNADKLLSGGFDYLIDAIDHTLAKSHLLAECHRRKIPVITCGGAGGLRDPSQIQVDDLARSYNDAVLNQVRKDLRNHYGFPRGADPAKKLKLKKFGIECVFSTEVPVFPQCDGSVSNRRPEEGEGKGGRLNCAAGFGSITHMTASVGFHAVARCLACLAGA